MNQTRRVEENKWTRSKKVAHKEIAKGIEGKKNKKLGKCMKKHL